MASIPSSSPRITAVDAIGPAFRRTFSLLTKPFFLGKFLKQTILAGFAEVSYFSMIIAIPMQIIQMFVMGGMPQHRGDQALPSGSFNPQVFIGTIAVICGIGVLIVSTLLLYFICRLRFVVMDWVLYGHGSCREGWRKYGRQSWRYFGLTILLSVGVLLVATVVAGPLVPWGIHIMRGIDPSQPESAAKVLSIFFPLFAIMMGLGIFAYVTDALVRDLMLPPMGLTDAPIETCFRRLFSLFRSEPGETSLYVLLRMLLGTAFQWAATLVVLIPMVILAVLGVLIGAVLYHSLWSTGSGGQLLFIAYAVMAAGIWLVLYLGGIAAGLGLGGIFKQTYALTWLSTRYPEVTTIVYGSPAPAATTAETSLPPTPPPDIAPPLLG